MARSSSVIAVTLPSGISRETDVRWTIFSDFAKTCSTDSMTNPAGGATKAEYVGLVEWHVVQRF